MASLTPMHDNLQTNWQIFHGLVATGVVYFAGITPQIKTVIANEQVKHGHFLQIDG